MISLDGTSGPRWQAHTKGNQSHKTRGRIKRTLRAERGRRRGSSAARNGTGWEWRGGASNWAPRAFQRGGKARVQ